MEILKNFLEIGTFICIYFIAKQNVCNGLAANNNCDKCSKLVNFSSKLKEFFNKPESNEIFELCKTTFPNDYYWCSPIIETVNVTIRKIDSETCNAFGVCGKPIESEEKDLDFICDLCLYILRNAKDSLKNDSSIFEKFKKFLNASCMSFKSSGMPCLEEHSLNVEDVKILILEGLSPRFTCEQLNDCNPKSSLNYSSEVVNFPHLYGNDSNETENNGPTCPMCKMILSWVFDKIKNNKTKDAIIEALDTVCTKIYFVHNNECESFVNNSMESIIKVIQQAHSAELACSFLFLCEDKPIKVKNDPSKCLFCKKIIEWIYITIKDNRTEDKIKNALEKVCSTIFSKSEEKKCKNFVESYTVQIIDVITKTASPTEACVLMKFCDEEVVVNDYVDSKESNEKICDTCKKIFLIINRFVKEGMNISDQFLLHNICSCFPEQEREKCNNFIDKWMKDILDIAESKMNPDQACHHLHICSSQEIESSGNENDSSMDKIADSDKNEVETEGASTQNKFCYECETITHFIQEKLYSYNTEVEIKNFVKNHICNQISKLLNKETCQAFISEYGDAIIELIALKIFDPTVVCEKELKLCPVSKFDIVFSNPDEEPTCKTCVELVIRMENLVEYSPDILATINSSDICDESQNQKKCEEIFVKFGNHFKLMVGFVSSAKRACVLFDLCFTGESQHILGGEKCTFGPIYWCHTQHHARACKATGYCKKNVWKAIESIE